MKPKSTISLRTAAIIAGLSILGMVLVAPYAELYVYPKLVDPGNPAGTVAQILRHKTLFVSAIFCYLVTFVFDIVVTVALYILFRPVNNTASFITAGFRLIYAIVLLVALLNLVTVYRMVSGSGYLAAFNRDQFNSQVMLALFTFKTSWSFGILFFGIHLVLVGYLAIRSAYIPSIIGVVVIISGLGYLLTSLKPFLLPDINTDFAMYTFYGELIFMLWLLIRGPRIKEPVPGPA